MDFFRHQEQARRFTARLIGLFVLALTILIGGIYLICGYLFSAHLEAGLGWWDPTLFTYVASGTLALVGGGSLYKINQLRGGGASVARSLGGTHVDHGTKDPELRTLVNVIEEMAIASGLPTPQAWVLDHEQGINAFAAGMHPGNAVIAVTRGCLQQLSRDELQGVVAHEFSHIINGDMRLNIRLMGLVHGLLCISVAGSIILRSSGGGHRYAATRTRGSVPILGLGLALWVAGFIGTLFARMIKAAVSRQREYLADAAAVQFTRNPEGISSALKRIAGFLPPRVSHLARGSKMRSAHAEEASHMFFSSGLMRVANLMNTHPPLLERIRRVQPGFQPRRRTHAAEPIPQSARGESAMGFAAGAVRGTGVSPEELVARVGNPNPEDLDTGRKLLAGMPEELRDAAHDAFSARALVYALLLSPSAVDRRYQLHRIQSLADPMTLQETIRLAPTVTRIAPEFRLPLLDLTLPALREMSTNQSRTFLTCVHALIDDESHSGYFEICLRRVLLHHLEDPRSTKRPVASKSARTAELASDHVTVLSTLAHAGHADLAAAQAAYAAGLAVLDHSAEELEMQPAESCLPSNFETSLDRLAQCRNHEQRKFLLACARSAASDEVIETAEAELLRAIADSFDCPLPPLRNERKAAKASSQQVSAKPGS